VRALFTLTLFLSSCLLFLIQPMVAKMILPTFGGAPAVWSASLVFFQGALLLGYGYAHLSTSKLGPRRQWLLHLPLMLVALVALPLSTQTDFFGSVQRMATEPGRNPALLVILALGALVGLPFFVVSAGAPILQRWFASTSDPAAKDPYFLYSASNLGSMLALLAYPFLLEPRLSLTDQSRFWTAGYIALLVAMALCAFALVRAKKAETTETEEVEEEAPPTTWKQRGLWILLAAVPSSLLLGVTTYVTSNVAPIPLLWVVPLALYLLTFIFAFANRQIVTAKHLGRLLPLLVAPLAIVIVLESSSPLWPLATLHLVVFFVAAWMCHARLHATRPAPARLTEFYFWMSLGGVIGGAFNALLAPLLFNTLAEYPLALVLACILRPPILSRQPKEGSNPSLYQRLSSVWNRRSLDLGFAVATGLVAAVTVIIARNGIPALQVYPMGSGPLRTFLTLGLPAILCFLAIDRPLRFGLALGALFLVSNALHTSSDGKIAATERSFFGVHRVVLRQNDRFHNLVHGNTLHGIQDYKNPDRALTYYHRTGPIGQVFREFSGPKAKDHVALVGLGVGSLAAYGEEGRSMTFFEIDPTVLKVASDPRLFTFLSRSKARPEVVLGDARLTLARQPDGRFGIIVLDAFSSDAIPIHLLTKEAIQMYTKKLTPDGILAFHISNRYLDLEPVLAAAAKDFGMIALGQVDGPTSEEEDEGKTQSNWVLMARNRADFGKLVGRATQWSELEPTGIRVWTDDFSNVLSAFKQSGD
jgi:hypothetical protein